MIAAGVDVSTARVAVAGLTEKGRPVFHVVAIPPGRQGPRRLVDVRSMTQVACARFTDVGVCIVEIPWAQGRSSFALLSAAAVVMETIQEEWPGCAVLERTTSNWKANSVGFGSASKADVLQHVRGIGYDGDDQDVADALAMSQAAWNEWAAMERRQA